jgi:hypothetical protein
MDLDYLKIIVTVVLAVIGWITSSYITSKRDRKNKRRAIVTDKMMDAYKVLTHEINERELTNERVEALENLISDLQLIGSPEIVALTKKLAIDAVSNDQFPLDDLINEIRRELRKELDLNSIQGNVLWFRKNK